jgi:hypothetical protein
MALLAATGIWLIAWVLATRGMPEPESPGPRAVPWGQRLSGGG